MPHESLDDLISKKAVEFADQVKQAAAMADKEEEIRIGVERQLAFFAKAAGVTLEGRHEFTVASGRIDSVYQRVIIEYKNPSSPGDRIGPRPDSPGTKKVVEQIKKRFYDLQSEQHQPINSLFGVGLDGNHFVFVRFRDDKWQVQDPVEVNKVSAERFLWALFNLGQKGKPFSPEYLAGDFGAVEGSIATVGIHTLYEAISGTTNPKAQVFFSQWKILFGEVCGYDVDSPSDKIKKLADFYGVPLKGFKPAELLFAVHTYYALFMKLLAAEIVAFFHKLPTPLQKMMQATTGAKLKREMEELEAGSIFRHLNITNFLEGDLFAWYVPIWAEPIEELVRAMVIKLDEYNPGTLSEDPAGSRDLLKKLYQQLFPKSVRHDLGEYYTPDWLAEHVLDELGYDGDPDKRILDPGCGSGTFPVMEINRIRQWYDKNREKCGFGEGDLCRKILANVIGFDLNPLAVMAARTNYLLAIRDLIGHVDKVEIPIYLCDSILTPSAHGGLFAGGLGKAKELKTAAAEFVIPTEIATSQDDVAKYAEQLESCVRNGYSPKEFIERCQQEGLPVSAENLHTDLYNELVRLDKANKNGVWARIIKNAFAPLFVGRVDFVAGNPPWVNWESLPEDYRNMLKPLWERYGLFTLTGSAGRLGGGKKDLSMLFLYSGMDAYLEEGGRLGFVITQTVFKTQGAGDGFRQLHYTDGDRKVFLRPVVVHDLSGMQVFEGATNRTAVFVCEKQWTNFTYPVPYVMWTGPSRVQIEEDLRTVLSCTHRQELGAVPIDPDKATSPWLTVPKRALGGIRRALGKSPYRGYAGSCTWLNGVFWVRVVREMHDGSLLIENLSDIGKSKVEQVQAHVEPGLVFPLLRGRDVWRWRASPSAFIVLSQDPETRSGFAESEMKARFPKTYAYLKRFEERLRQRSGYRQYYRPTDPFYSLYNVGPQTLAPWKVMWPEVGNTVSAGVCGPHEEDADKPCIPDHTLIAVSCDGREEAHFLCALLNSAPAQCAVTGYIVLHPSPHILEHVAIPQFDRKDGRHIRLAQLSEECHRVVSEAGEANTHSLENEINECAADLWGIKANELRAIQDALGPIESAATQPPDNASDE